MRSSVESVHAYWMQVGGCMEAQRGDFDSAVAVGVHSLEEKWKQLLNKSEILLTFHPPVSSKRNTSIIHNPTTFPFSHQEHFLPTSQPLLCTIRQRAAREEYVPIALGFQYLRALAAKQLILDFMRWNETHSPFLSLLTCHPPPFTLDRLQSESIPIWMQITN